MIGGGGGGTLGGEEKEQFMMLGRNKNKEDNPCLNFV